MANKARGEVAIMIGSREYTLRLSINAICELETELERRKLDSNYLVFFSKVKDGSIAAARLLLWACLRDHHPVVTVDAAGELIEQAGDLAAIWSALGDAMGRSQPEPEDVAALKTKEDAANPPTARAGGTGTRSRRPRAGRA